MHKPLSHLGLFPLAKASRTAQPRLQGSRERARSFLMPEAIIKSHCEGTRMEEWEEFETIVQNHRHRFNLFCDFSISMIPTSCELKSEESVGMTPLATPSCLSASKMPPSTEKKRHQRKSGWFTMPRIMVIERNSFSFWDFFPTQQSPALCMEWAEGS